MRLLYKICRFLLLVIYFPFLLLTRKFPKYWDRLRIYCFELQRRSYAKGEELLCMHLIKNKGAMDFRMMLRSPGKIEDQLLALNKFEDHITKIMPQFMFPQTVFLDIGANIGFHTFNVLAHHPDAYAYCFEPNPEIKHELDRNVQINNWQDRIVTSDLALSDQAGSFDFYIMPKTEKNRGMSSLMPEAVDSRFEKIKVTAKPFDTFWQNVRTIKKRVSLIKIDTQGHEESVLHGMLETIEQDRPTLFLELETHLSKDKEKLWAMYQNLEMKFKYDFFIINKNGSGLYPISFFSTPIQDFSVDILGLPGFNISTKA